MKINTNYTSYDKKYYTYTPSHKRNWQEHASWGANYIKETGKANFKLFTFPDAKRVFVEIANNAAVKFGNIKDRTVQILGILGSAYTIKEILPQDSQTKIYPMENKGNGIFEAKDIDTTDNTSYRYIIAKDNHTINLVKDPYSKQQPDINGWSEIYNPDNYEWKSLDWLNGKDSRRIVRKPNEPLRGLDNLIIEEINIPTITQEGTFESAKKHIDKISQKGIATAIEIMPVENTYSPQWGYDGVDKMAVNEKLGGAIQLKSLIDYAHSKGLNVIIDMVPNHIGPDGDSLSQAGPYENGQGPFGGVPNYEGKDNRYVRDWMTNALLWWANEFKVDGLRLDMTQFCKSDYLLKQIVEEVNEHNPSVFLIAEDGRDNKSTITAYEKYDMSHEEKLRMIDESVNNIAEKKWHTYPHEIGFDSEWDFPFMHDLKDSLLTPSSIFLNKLDHKIKNSKYRVKYTMSHDEIGNEDGTRFIPKVIAKELDLFLKVSGATDTIKAQKAARISQALAELYISDDFDKMSDTDLAEYEKKLMLQDSIPKHRIKTAFEIALAKQKLGMGTIFTVPGPKMFFQGDDDGDLSNFKFFREFSNERQQRTENPDYSRQIIREKGYDPMYAKTSSMLGRVEETTKYSNIKKQLRMFSQAISNVFQESEALKTGDIVATHQDSYNNVHIHHLKKDKEEYLVIKNFGNAFHPKSYHFRGFPEGEWIEVLNSDHKDFGGSNYTNPDRKISKQSQGLSLAPFSISILKKV